MQRRIVSFTGDEIIAALLPLIRQRIGQDGHHYDLVQTRWENRQLSYPDGELPAGMIPMTVDVHFSLERRPESESS